MKNKITVILLLVLIITSLTLGLTNQSTNKLRNTNSLIQENDCLHIDGRETVYSFDLKPFEQMKIYNQLGDAVNENGVMLSINSINVKNFSNRSVSVFEYQNKTPENQFVEITSGMHFKKRDIENSTLQLFFEDRLCTIHRGTRGGGHDRDPVDYEYCDCKGSEPDYNDAYLMIKKF